MHAPQPDSSDLSTDDVSADGDIKGRLLCVDDERQILTSLRRLFRRSGHAVITANSAAEGLEVLAHNEIDVVISDMRMPEMDGNQFLTEVARQWPDTVRMLLTGYSDMDSTIGAINNGGIYRYIPKPWDDTDLLMCVDRALENKRLRHERDRLTALTQEQNQQLLTLNDSLERKVKERTRELEESNQQIELAYDESVAVFARIIGLREDHTATDNDAIARAADLVAQELALDDTQRKNLHYAALLHDIGKIGLPDSLLKTPYDTMSREQKEHFQQHCVNGEALLMSLAPLHGASSIIRSHHEQVGGSGYPDGLQGDDIPIEARILFVVNEFNELQSGMLLGRPRDAEFAIEYLESHTGRRYDKAVAKAFIKINETLENTRSVQKEMILSIYNVEPGMILAEDVYLRENVLMLRSGQVLTDTFIRKFKELKRGSQEDKVLKIRTS